MCSLSALWVVQAWLGALDAASLAALARARPHAHSGGVEHEHRERVGARHESDDGLDLVGGGWRRLFAFLARQPHAHAVTRRVLFHADEVEHLREHGQALADRLPLAARGMERRDEFGDVGWCDLVDAARAKEGEDAVELDAVADRVPSVTSTREVRQRSAASASVGAAADEWSSPRRGTRIAASSPATQRLRASASRLVAKEPA